MGDEFTVYGGIRFRKSEVETYAANKNENGKIDYTVKLKTGQILKYRDQYDPQDKLHPYVYANTVHNRPLLTGNDLTGVTIIGNPTKRDDIRLQGTSIANSIFVNNDQLRDDVTILPDYQGDKNGKLYNTNKFNNVYYGKEDNIQL